MAVLQLSVITVCHLVERNLLPIKGFYRFTIVKAKLPFFFCIIQRQPKLLDFFQTNAGFCQLGNRIYDDFHRSLNKQENNHVTHKGCCTDCREVWHHEYQRPNNAEKQKDTKAAGVRIITRGCDSVFFHALSRTLQWPG